jgi:hypothetical protein
MTDKVINVNVQIDKDDSPYKCKTKFTSTVYDLKQAFKECENLQPFDWKYSVKVGYSMQSTLLKMREPNEPNYSSDGMMDVIDVDLIKNRFAGRNKVSICIEWEESDDE